MSDTLGRILKRVAAGTSSGSNLQQAKRALAASTGHLLVSDLNHMGNEYASRRTWAHPGFADFWAGAPSGSVAAPNVADIDWTGPLYGTAGRTANACCGGTWVVPLGASDTLPRAVLRLRAACGTKVSSSMGIFFAVTPGRTFPTSTSNRASAVISSSTLADKDMSISLSQSDLAPLVTSPSTGSTTSGVAPIGAPVRLMVCSLWVGFSSNWNAPGVGQLASAFGITVGLEP